MDEMKHRRLQELDRSDFEIVKEEPDIRGWDVKNSAGLKIGEVEELIVDAQQQKVRYMVVDLDDKDLKLPDRKVLIPIGLAELHHDDDDVLLPTVTVDQLSTLPAYDEDTLDDEMEQRVCTALGRNEERATAILQGDNRTSREENIPTRTERPVMQPVRDRHSHKDDMTSHRDDTSSYSDDRKESRETQHSRQAQHTEYRENTQHTQQPPIGTAEYYGNFYQHAFFNDYNLYRNRQQRANTSETSNDPEYERGLRLWEMRAEGGIVPTPATERSATEHDPELARERELSRERRMEMVRNRRRSYEDRRGYPHRDDRSRDYRDSDHHDSDEHHHHRGDNSIIGRIRDEGLQDG